MLFGYMIDVKMLIFKQFASVYAGCSSGVLNRRTREDDICLKDIRDEQGFVYIKGETGSKVKSRRRNRY